MRLKDIVYKDSSVLISSIITNTIPFTLVTEVDSVVKFISSEDIIKDELDNSVSVPISNTL